MKELIDNVKLISEVYKYNALYNTKNKHYFDSEIKNEIWSHIAISLNCKPEACKARWKNLRTCFVNDVKKSERYTGEGKKCKKYQYYEKMRFLLPYLKKSRSLNMFENEIKLTLKQKFVEEVQKINLKESHYSILTTEQYSKLFHEIKDAHAAVKKTTMQYRRIKRFNIIDIDGVQKIVANSYGDGDQLLYYLPIDDIYDVIESTHIAVGHGGRDKLRKEISKRYANVTIPMINIYLSMCEVCISKREKRKQSFVSQTIALSTEGGKQFPEDTKPTPGIFYDDSRNSLENEKFIEIPTEYIDDDPNELDQDPICVDDHNVENEQEVKRSRFQISDYYQNNREDESLKLFFLSMYNTVKKFPTHMQIASKKEIFNIVTGYEEKLVQEASSSKRSTI